MRMNGRGQAIHGLNVLCLDGRVILPGVTIASGTVSFLNDDEVIYRALRKDWQLEILNITTGKTREPEDPPAVASGIEAGGNVWAAWTLAKGIRSNVHAPLPYAGLRGVGLDGTLGFSRLYKDGKGLVLRKVPTPGTAPEEMEVDAGVALNEVHVWAYGIAVYTTGRYELRSVGTTAPAVSVPEQVFEPRLVRSSAGEFVSYHTQDRALLHPIDNPHDGYVVRDAPGTFSTDAVEIAPGVIRVGWCVTKAEGPGTYRFLDINLADARTSLIRPSIAPLKYACRTGYFFAFSADKRYGSNPTAPGTCTVIVESGLKPPLPVVLAPVADSGEDLLLEYKGRWETQVLALYAAEETTPGGLAQKIIDTRHRVASLGLSPRPIICYSGPTPALNVGADIIGIEAYVNEGELVDQAEHRWRNALQMTFGKPVAIFGGAFDRRKGDGKPRVTAATLEAAQARLAELVRAVGANCKYLLWFSDGRPGGTRDYPQLRPWHLATVKAIPNPGPFVPPVQTVPTRVTIDSFVSSVRVNAKARAVAKLTQGDPPAFLRWRWRPHGTMTWSPATPQPNPWPDLDHSFVFEVAGKYDIGVDALDADKRKLDGTTSERLVTVAA